MGDPRCFFRIHVGSYLFGDGDARFKWSRPLSSQISSSGHLMEAALKKELVACGLVYALSSVSGLTAVAFAGNALPTRTTEVISRLVCAGKMAGTSGFQGILRSQVAKVLGIQRSPPSQRFLQLPSRLHPGVALSFRAVSCARLSPAFSRQLFTA